MVTASDDFISGALDRTTLNEISNTSNSIRLLGANNLQIDCNTFEDYTNGAIFLEDYINPNNFSLPPQGECVSNIATSPAYNIFSSTLSTEDIINNSISGNMEYNTYPSNLPTLSTSYFPNGNGNLNIEECSDDFNASWYNPFDPCEDLPYPSDNDYDSCGSGGSGIPGNGDGGLPPIYVEPCFYNNQFIKLLEFEKRKIAVTKKLRCLASSIANFETSVNPSVQNTVQINNDIVFNNLGYTNQVLSFRNTLRYFKKENFVQRFAIEYYFNEKNFEELQYWLKRLKVINLDDLHFKFYYKSLLKYELSFKSKKDRRKLKKLLDYIVKTGYSMSFKAREVLFDEFNEFYPLYFPVISNTPIIKNSENYNSNNQHNYDSRELTLENILSVYPNPTSNFVNIDTNLDILENIVFIAFDINGKKIFSKECNTNKCLIDISDLQNGVYTYQILFDGEILKQDKLVIIH